MQHRQSGEPEEAKSEESSSCEHRTSEITVSTETSTIGSSARHRTGPRTLEGKQRSKRNATKDGIFSTVVVDQLDRLQRTRLGQSVAPRIDLNVPA
jgi:hypothetical protein